MILNEAGIAAVVALTAVAVFSAAAAVGLILIDDTSKVPPRLGWIFVISALAAVFLFRIGVG